jgi:hypothetical protein
MGRIVCMRYEAYCLHKAKQVCHFAGIATYCLHKAKQAVTYTTYDKGTKK